jgi:hypothetical protein
MIDLKNLGGGKQLIKEIVETSKSNNQPWTKKQQLEKIRTHKNTHSPQSRSTHNF